MVELKKKKTKATYKDMKLKFGDEYWTQNGLSPLDNHKYRLAHMVENWGDAVMRRAPKLTYNCIYQLCKDGFLGLDDLPNEQFKNVIDSIWKADLDGKLFDTDPVKAAYGL